MTGWEHVNACIHSNQDLRIPAISVGAIRESPLHLGLDEAICVSPIYMCDRPQTFTYPLPRKSDRQQNISVAQKKISVCTSESRLIKIKNHCYQPMRTQIP